MDDSGGGEARTAAFFSISIWTQKSSGLIFLQCRKWTSRRASFSSPLAVTFISALTFFISIVPRCPCAFWTPDLPAFDEGIGFVWMTLKMAQSYSIDAAINFLTISVLSSRLLKSPVANRSTIPSRMTTCGLKDRMAWKTISFCRAAVHSRSERTFNLGWFILTGRCAARKILRAIKTVFLFCISVST